MTTSSEEAFARLRSGLPALAPTTELILRPEKKGPVAMLRPQGSPPRTFALLGDDVVELTPAADDGLPAAPLLGDPDRLCRALAPFLGATAAPHLMAWRPGKRAVLRLDRGGSQVFVKFLDRKTWARAAAVFATLADPVPPLQFARPCALMPGLCGYAAMAAPGRSLRELLAAGTPPPWPLLDASIRSLAAVRTHAELPLHDFAAARHASATMLRKAAAMEPTLAALADAVDQLPDPQQPASGFVHGDLHDKQIFVHDGGTQLIDLEGVGRGDPRFDLVNLAEHLRLRSLQQTGADDGPADALLARCGHDDHDQLLWRAVVRARLTGVYALRPRWDRLTARLHSETKDLLDLA